MSRLLVEVAGVSVRLGDHQALEQVDLALHEREIVSLIGPNGAGKSTLVKLVLGILEPDTGRVTRAPGLRFAYMPQRLAIDPTLPIDVDRLLDLPHRHSASEKREALERVGVTGLGRRPLQALSGGELQRVLLARALLRRPDLLVLDEPAAGIDYQGQAAFFGLIDSVRREQGCGILVVSHDLHLVMAATDRVVCLNRHICCSGTPEAVGDDPVYLELFGPRTGAALARYHHHHDHEHALSGEIAHPADCEHH